jgi:hypothetical protein
LFGGDERSLHTQFGASVPIMGKIQAQTRMKSKGSQTGLTGDAGGCEEVAQFPDWTSPPGPTVIVQLSARRAIWNSFPLDGGRSGWGWVAS